MEIVEPVTIGRWLRVELGDVLMVSIEGRRENSRNGHTEKAVKTESGTMTVRVPSDRDGRFTPRVAVEPE